MPPKKERLSQGLFKKLGTRTVIRSTSFDVAYFPFETLKVACVISKKRIKKAVFRNKVRRKMYHAFYESGPRKNYAVIIYPKIEALHLPYAKLVSELQQILATIN